MHGCVRVARNNKVLCLCECVCVGVTRSMYTFTYVYIFASRPMCMFKYVCMYIRMNVCSCVLCMEVHVCRPMYICMSI